MVGYSNDLLNYCAEGRTQYRVGLPVLLMHKGLKEAPIFFADEDYSFYLELLAQGARRYSTRIHAYCLLDDRVYLLLTPGNASSLHFVVTHAARIHKLYLQRKYMSEGLGFDEEFKHCPLNPNQYLLKCSRFIESVALTEQLDVLPEQYKWSSYPVNARGQANEVLDPHSLYLLLGRNRVQRYLKYRDLFEDILSSREIFTIRRALDSGCLLGDSVGSQEEERLLLAWPEQGKLIVK